LESNNKERNKMSEIETLNERIADLERRLAQMHHPCMTRVEDLQEVIIRLTNEHNKVLQLELADLKKQTSATTKLQVVANNIEFGHSHGA
jgi:regulator of replication initiation timing